MALSPDIYFYFWEVRVFASTIVPRRRYIVHTRWTRTYQGTVQTETKDHKPSSYSNKRINLYSMWSLVGSNCFTPRWAKRWLILHCISFIAHLNLLLLTPRQYKGYTSENAVVLSGKWLRICDLEPPGKISYLKVTCNILDNKWTKCPIYPRAVEIWKKQEKKTKNQNKNNKNTKTWD